MAHILVRNVDEDLVAELKRQAEESGRSLEAEVREILAQSSRARRDAFIELADSFRARLGGPNEPNSADLIAEDRRR